MFLLNQCVKYCFQIFANHVLRIKYLNSAVETQTAFANFADDWHDKG